MGYLKTKGIIIREVNTGEADKIVTIFTKSHGKMSGFAKNARRSKNLLAAGTQLLCYSDLMLFKGKDLYTISSCEVVEPFYEIRNDIVKLTYAAHMVDLVGDIIQENQPATKVLQLFLNTLHFLAKSDKSPELLARIFELRLMSILGYAPFVKGCIHCGLEPETKVFFSFRKCGFLCGKCIPEDRSGMEISQGTAKALFHIVYSRIQELFHFDLSPEVLNELARISRRYLKDRLEREYNKLDFLKSLEL
jgi:DNA repair protein RecO (recombination protein O)